LQRKAELAAQSEDEQRMKTQLEETEEGQRQLVQQYEDKGKEAQAKLKKLNKLRTKYRYVVTAFRVASFT
jgi:hypothetical protein